MIEFYLMMDKHSQQLITIVYVGAMLCVFPLAVRNGYFDILDIKWLVCVSLTVLYILLMTAASAIGRIGAIKAVRKNNAKANEIRLRKSKSERALMIFAGLYSFAVFLGALFCEHKAISFWGLTGRYLGVSVVLPLVLSLFLIERNYIRNSAILYCVGISSFANYILQILNQFKIDPLGMWNGLEEKQISYFAGTLGNLNFNAVYDCMMLSIAMSLFVSEEYKTLQKQKGGINRSNIVFALYIATGFAALICTRSDGAFLGIGAALLVLFMYTLKYNDRTGRFLDILLLCLGGSAAVSVIYHLVPEDARFDLVSLSALAVRSEFIAGGTTLLCIIAAIFNLLYRKGHIDDRAVNALLVAVLVLSGLGLLFTIKGQTQPDFSFEINDHTAHNRVFVWRNTLGMMKEYTLLQWIFGCGINEFRFAFSDYCGAEMISQGYNRFIDAHSEYLQSLASTGIAGTIGYFGMVLTILITEAKRRSVNLSAITFIVVFLVCGLVYSPQITTTPLLFILLGILRNDQISSGIRE